MRLVPLGRGLAPCEPLLDRSPQIASSLRRNGWEVGRLVLDEKFRSTPEILRSCFFLILTRFIESHPTANFFATCSPLFSRLYRRFGFSMLLKDACVTEHEVYSLIYGNVGTVGAAVGLACVAEDSLAAG